MSNPELAVDAWTVPAIAIILGHWLSTARAPIGPFRSSSTGCEGAHALRGRVRPSE